MQLQLQRDLASVLQTTAWNLLLCQYVFKERDWVQPALKYPRVDYPTIEQQALNQ